MTAGILSIPAVFMRGGTSKGLFFHARDLPENREARDAIFLRALGSPDSYGRQLDGMGGGLSSLSKAVIIGPPTREDADLDYIFAQVAVDRPMVDYGGTCGNLASAVAQFAVDEGLIAAAGEMAVVRIHAVNTGKIIRAHVPVRGGRAQVDGALVIPGISFGGAPIRLEFIDPDGSRTGRLLPGGGPAEFIDIPGIGAIRASLVDAANPCVFVRAADLGLTGAELPEELDADLAGRALLEAIRAAAGVRIGFGVTPEAVSEASQSSPKIALVAPPRSMRTLDGASLDAGSHDLCVRMISMGQAHRAVPLTGALCVAVAARIPGTVVYDMLADSARGQGDLRLGTASGVVSVAAEIVADAGGFRTNSAVAYRTARRLMEGNVLVPTTA
ncbi:PrpF family protein [Sphingomonas sp. TF3]|uniref:2-methylaconitate cis-trans isomerase PrpF family protein n=1 Tax=Sphingomonas sp. TF3 TaxID=2495580 RepID=UPI000F86D703|nr:PrpF domain-containing protein [Sphingomonas sp. TF3]RUN78352.1 PrpF family protein [Sphingomonas sp. TF3]